jgi:hypothetical protein
LRRRRRSGLRVQREQVLVLGHDPAIARSASTAPRRSKPETNPPVHSSALEVARTVPTIGSVYAPKPMFRRIAPFVAATAVIGPTAPAAADTYTVHSCKTPDGRPAGLVGWTRPVIGLNSTGANYCGRGSYWIAFMKGRAAHLPGSRNEMTFDAPPDTFIRSYAIWRSAVVCSRTKSCASAAKEATAATRSAAA